MLALINGQVMTMDGKTWPRADLLIRDGKIAAVGPDLPVPDGAEVIDVSGKLLLPGLIDAHCHLGLVEEGLPVEGDDLNEVTKAVTPHLRALDGINPQDEAFADALSGGVTAVFVTPGSANVIGGEGVVLKTWGQVADRMVLRQPAGLKVALGENPKRIYRDKPQGPVTRMGTAAMLRDYLVRADNYRRQRDKNPEEPRQLDLEPLVRVLEGVMPLRAHAHRADDIMTAVRVAEEFKVELVLEHCTEGELVVAELQARQLPAVVGPGLINRSKAELRRRNWRTPGILASEGVLVALMTDHPVVPIQYLSLCAALAVREGMDPEQALHAITINAATILGVADRVGSLTPGKDADIVVWDGSPLNGLSKVELVLVGGQLVWGSGFTLGIS